MDGVRNIPIHEKFLSCHKIRAHPFVKIDCLGMRSASSPHAKQKALKSADFKAFGAAGQIRTADLILTKDALYLLSYSSEKTCPFF